MAFTRMLWLLSALVQGLQFEMIALENGLDSMEDLQLDSVTRTVQRFCKKLATEGASMLPALMADCVRFIDHNDDLLPEFLLQHGPLQLTRFVCAELEGVCDEAQTPPMELFDTELFDSMHDLDEQDLFGFNLDQDFPDMDELGLGNAHDEL